VTGRDSVLKKLNDGEVAFGVSSKKIEQADLEYQDFFEDRVILVVPADHRWANFRQVYPDDLLDEPMILREDAAGTREVLLDGLRRSDITPEMLNIAMVLGNAEAIAMAVEEGLGIAFISHLAAARGIALGRLVEVSVEGMALTRHLYMARNARQPQTRAQTEFWEFVKNSQTTLRQSVQSEVQG
jgi:DNA-binding transcriptional LysR family regulator